MQLMFRGCSKLKLFQDKNKGENEIIMIYKIEKENIYGIKFFNYSFVNIIKVNVN